VGHRREAGFGEFSWPRPLAGHEIGPFPIAGFFLEQAIRAHPGRAWPPDPRGRAMSEIRSKGTKKHTARDAEPACHLAIVDDDESVRRAVGRLLSSYDFQVRTYPSGAAFLESLKQGAPDCLILDLHMPGMTGLEVLHALSGAGFSFPVLIATAQDELGIRSRCQLAGAMAFLAKPFLIEPVLEALALALGRPVSGLSDSQSQS
jgi:CheY-like chemotaxis protein